jgi:hypothetical protein
MGFGAALWQELVADFPGSTMLVTLGATLVALVPELTGMSNADLSQIIQGFLIGLRPVAFFLL